jgi:hypothetical protein
MVATRASLSSRDYTSTLPVEIRGNQSHPHLASPLRLPGGTLAPLPSGADQTNMCVVYARTQTPAPQERGTSDGGRPLAVRRAHRAEGECAIAGSEERAGNLENVVGTWYLATIGNNKAERLGLPHEVNRGDIAQIVPVELIGERGLAPDGEGMYVGTYVDAAPC